ncbi:MAG: acetoacetate decarboxylase family protein [Geothrix sp.]|uniref:acetoacetate decarboxylase family protein n=1 Tax=Geothrix sp. TaxID=1962974 RepID=UPI001790DCD1|nr:acetoacetate decarboxylase family protein [Geothrix sp.]NWJ41283.1 acetoacetate decarboxylase family protein [Geothrix sp.]WIL20727.1 MAG: acetoacetate decarboxylase family protein [Geothrix sp.]
MGVPSRVLRATGRHALVDGIPFQLPVLCEESPALFAVFPIDADKARALLPGNEIHPLRFWNRGLLVVSVMDYRKTSIGKYIEFSVGIACTRGPKPAPRLLPALLPWFFNTGQFVVELPVSTEISTKGGKGIWGMPKHQGSLDYQITDQTVSSQYDLDGQLGIRISIQRPGRAWLPLSVSASNYCAYRGMIWKSNLHFKAKAGLTMFKKGIAELLIGDHPRLAALKGLGIGKDALFAAFIPSAQGVLDDHVEGWFYSEPNPITARPEGFESVVNLGLGQDWPPAPTANGRRSQ